MPTIIELHLLTYFCLFFLMSKSVKLMLKTCGKTWVIVLCSAAFACIKFLMDYFNANIFAQMAVVFFYVLTANLGVHKFSHVYGLIVSSAIFGFYYACLMGLNAGLYLVSGVDMYYISNLYLVLVCGINLIMYSLLNVFKEYYKLKSSLKLTKICTLKVGNRKMQFSGFIDTGNSLKDPISGKAVVIISMKILKKYLSNQMYADLLFATNASGSFDGIHKIKYATISGTNFITVFKPQTFMAESKPVDCYIGVSSADIACGALLNVACL